MEELFAYALLFCQGYGPNLWERYAERLDQLFLAEPDNEEYLYLECVTSPKEAALHLIAAMSETDFDTELFGRALMELIGEVYAKSNLIDFSKQMVSLWCALPNSILLEEPFHILSYADEHLTYGGGEPQCRALYEKAIHYYDKK